MINIEKMNSMVPKYVELTSTREKLIKTLKDYEIAYADNLDYFIKIYKEIRETELKIRFKNNNDILKRYFYLKNSIKNISHDINELLKNSDEVKEFDIFLKPYVALKHIKDDGYDIINLITQETINLNDFDYNTQKMLVQMLQKNRSFIGYITRDDLPLLMTMLESGRYRKMDRYNKMGTEIAKAHMTDDKIRETAIIDPITKKMRMISNNLPYIYDSRKIEKLWGKLDTYEDYLSDDECCIKYFEYLLLFNDDIEKVYYDAETNYDKKMMIDAYFRISRKMKNPLDESEYVRLTTASPLINEEVLKRRYAKIK